MSTDTAFALGLLALVGPRFPDRLRAFMLTVVVVDDIVALVVIATVYTEDVAVSALARSPSALFARRPRRCGASACGVGLVYAVLGAAAWVALLEVGRRAGRRRARDGPPDLRLPGGRGRTSSARPSASASSASSRRRSWPARRASELRAAISPNERLQQLYHPWTSYVIVPLFALANAGIAIDGDFLARAFTSPITLGILVGYVVGKPVGIVGSSWLRHAAEPRAAAAAGRLGGGRRRRHDRRHRLHRLAADRDARLRRARSSRRRSSASSARRSCASLLTWLVFRATALLPRAAADPGAARARAEPLVDLAVDGRSGARPRPRADRRAGHGRRVRRLRVPVLRAGRAGRPRAAARLRRRPLRLAAPAAERRPPARPARRRGGRGRRRPGRVLGDARPAARPPGRARARTT